MNRLAFGLLLLSGLVLAKVSFPAIRTTVDLSPDGNAHVVQQMTCRFEGKSPKMRLVFPAWQQEGRVVFGGVTERSVPVEGAAASELEGQYIIKWSPRATDETRSYVVDFTVENVVRRYDDLARVRFPVITSAPGPVDLATVELRLPKAAAHTFRLADSSAIMVSADRRSGLVERRNMARGDVLWIEALTDPDVFDEVPRRAGRMAKVESRRPFEGHLPSDGPLMPWYYVLVPLFLPLLLLLGFYLAYGREPPLAEEGPYRHEPPARIPPLAVPPIMRQQPDLTELPEQTLDATLATLLDAAGRGVLDIRPGDSGTGEGRGFVLSHPDKLRGLDEVNRKVVDYYFNCIGGGRTAVTVEDIRRHAAEQPEAFLFWLKEMSIAGRDWWWKNLGVGFLEPASWNAYQLFCYIGIGLTAIAGFLLPLGFRMTIESDPVRLGALLGFGGGFLAALVYGQVGRPILRWSPPAYNEHLRWERFRRFLVDFSAIEQAPIELAAIWQEYYVYAVALGIGRKFMQGLSSLAPALARVNELRPSVTGETDRLRAASWDSRDATAAAFGQGISLLLEAFRTGSGVQGKRTSQQRQLLFWRVGKM